MIEPHFTESDLLRSLFDPVLRREVDDFAATQGWEKLPALDLRTVPREKWAEVEDWPIAFPVDLQSYLDGRDASIPLTTMEIDNIEERMDAFYATGPDFTILLTKRGVATVTRNTDG